MRRSICYCEPNHALAGEVNTWKFIYTTSSPLPKGTLLKFDLCSDGRPIDWEIPSSNIKDSENIIYAELENGKVLAAKEIELDDRFTPQYEFTLPQDIEVGESLAIVVGAPKGKKTTESNGNSAQCITQRRRSFLLYIDPTAKGHYGEPEVFPMDIRGNVLKKIKIMVPSFVSKNKRFDIVVRFEDDFCNLTSNTDDETLIELTHENIRENLNWKLFIPETGFITLPNLYFNEPGTYTIELKNLSTGESFKAPPITCFADSESMLLWGTLHGESERIDSAENIESCIRHFRDERAYNFYGISPFESQEETSAEIWKVNVQNVADFDETDRFTTFLGFQWPGAKGVEGVRQIIFNKDNKQLIRKKDPKGTTLKKLYKNFSPKEMIAIPSFSMGDGTEFNFENFDQEFERVVEIYNAWGSSECTEKEGNPLPIQTLGKVGIKENAEGSIIEALKKNCRFGFVGGGLDDRGIYSEFYDSDQEQYTPGLTAIISQEHSRAALFEALYQRSCYATTGERMIVGFSIAGTSIGQEVSTADKPGLMVNRHLDVYAAGTDDLEKVEIIRNGEVIHTVEPKDAYHVHFTYDDMEPFDKVMIDNKDKRPPFAFYYVRVTQKDGHIAWCSPIWIDYVVLSAAERKARRMAKPTKKITAKESFGADLDFSLDDEEENEESDDDDYDDGEE